MARKKNPTIIFGNSTHPAGWTRASSPRNTKWNGVDSSGGRWKGHSTSPSDTFQQAGLFQIQGRGFDKVQALLEQAGTGVNRMADDLVAKAGAEGRKEATRIEEQEFRLGKVFNHSNYGGGFPMPNNGKVWKSASRFDPALGGYRGVSEGGNTLRLINFHFSKESIAERKPMLTPTTASVKVTSQLANLFENDAVWRKNSPYWQKENGEWMNWRKHSVRHGRHYFDKFYRAFDQGLDRAIPKAERSFKSYMNKSYTRKPIRAVAP